MIVLCASCLSEFEDQYRLTICPHNTFFANDGHNRFQHHPDAHLHKVTDAEMIERLTNSGCWKKKFNNVWASPRGKLLYLHAAFVEFHQDQCFVHGIK